MNVFAALGLMLLGSLVLLVILFLWLAHLHGRPVCEECGSHNIHTWTLNDKRTRRHQCRDCNNRWNN